MPLSQSQCRVGWFLRISRTPLVFEISDPFAFSDTTRRRHLPRRRQESPCCSGSSLLAKSDYVALMATSSSQKFLLEARSTPDLVPSQGTRGMSRPLLNLVG